MVKGLGAKTEGDMIISHGEVWVGLIGMSFEQNNSLTIKRILAAEAM